MSFGGLELDLIYRVGELIKGIGSALMNYAAKKKEQMGEIKD